MAQMPRASAAPPKAIILDLDDTILDSGEADVSWRRICAEFAGNFDGVTPEGFFDALIDARDWFWDNDRQAREGRLDLLAARRTIFKRALSSLGVASPEPALVDAMARRYTGLREEAVTPFRGALAALERLRGSGVRLALLTNGSTETQWGKIRRFGLTGFFDHIQVEGDLGFGKPDARAFRYALAALDVESDEAWMVGDNLLADIEGAQRAGIFAVWIDAHGSGLDTRDGVAPDRVVKSLDELLETLPRDQ
ncbi:MAG: HAD-IA family hydrolase [Gammaproteobacteria bacterium]|nr:HAD-IA family hydrolase [Gammaproteobacteria bacterium]